MATFVYLFKNDMLDGSVIDDMTAWNAFIDELRKGGHFIGGGALGEGCVRQRAATTDEVSDQFAGYMVVTAKSLQEAAALLDDCPTIRGGGSVEVRCVPEA